jgi:Tol biopolymer transport system component
MLVTALQLLGAGCEDGSLTGLNYLKMLENEYTGEGKGKAIPVAIEKATEIDGSLNADGAYFVYASDRERGNFDIYLRKMTDIASVRLTAHSSKDFSPAISPNGKYLAFVSLREDPLGDIMTARINPSKLIKNYKKNPDSAVIDSDLYDISKIVNPETNAVKMIKDANPAWSPDSELIAFSSDRNGEENIFICDYRGRGLRQITRNGGVYPSFSPDGKNMVFVSYRENSLGEIHTVNIESGEENKITAQPGIKLFPVFGKDGTCIYYTLIDRDTNADGALNIKDKSAVYFRDIAGGDNYRMTFGENSSFNARWFPSSRLYYSGTKELISNGVLVFSEQSSDNININIIPDFGMIPKRLTARKQLELAHRYLTENNDLEMYSAGLHRVYYFFKDKNDIDSVVAVSRSLKNAVEDLKNVKERETSLSLLKKYSQSAASGSAYPAIMYEALVSAAEKRSAQAVLEKYADDSGTSNEIKPYLLEDIGDSLVKNGKKGAEKYYAAALKNFPDSANSEQIRVKYLLIKNTVDLETNLDTYLTVLGASDESGKISVINTIMGNYNKYPPAKRLDVISSDMSIVKNKSGGADAGTQKTFTELERILNYCSGCAKLEIRSYHEAMDLFNKALAGSGKNFIYYKSNVKLSEIYRNLNNSDGSQKALYSAISEYNPLWNDPDFKSSSVLLMNNYESAGFNYENGLQYAQALEI